MPIDDLTALGQKMREARKNKELTQQELSDLSHVSVKQIANIEKGKMNPSYLILRALAKDFVIMRCQSPHEAALGEMALPDRPAICYSSFREVSDSLQWTVHSQYRWCHLADEPPWCCPKSFGTSGHILS